MAQREHNSSMRPHWPPSSADYGQLLTHIETLQQQLDQVHGEQVWSHRLTTLGTMAAVLAHEYNNLLTPLASYAQLALSEPGDAALTRKALETVVDAVQRATAIASATLDFARPGEGGEAAADLLGTIDRSLACLARPLDRDGIAMRIDVPDCRVRLGQVQLQQILINLITNARKAMLSIPGPHTLRITGRTGDSQTMRLDITDNGPGIPDAIRERVFEPFITCPHQDRSSAEVPTLNHEPKPPRPTRAPEGSDDNAHIPSSRKPEPGTGLGLSICRDLIESAGGRIEIMSERGRGTTIRLTLPTA